MANEAHKEPTMEEILASIRRIIADDGPAPAAQPAARPALRETRPLEAVPSPPKSFDYDTAGDLGMFEGEDADDFEDDTVSEEISGPEFSFEEMLGASKAREEPPAPKPAPAPAPEPVKPEAPVAQDSRRAPAMETAMPASPRYSNDPLTNDNTADAAAGALGKLISKMDLGSDNTIEGLVRELLKPMVKDWLDANLPRIVEEKVEAEVQRIARMAR